MEQSIFRIQKDRDNPYVMVNKQLLNNAELSWKAKGLLTYLLSLPDNWQIYEDEIVKHAKDGKDSLKSAIKELIANGYIERERIRNSSGQLKGYSYCVYEIHNQSGKSNDGKTIKGKSATNNTNSTNNNVSNNKINMGIASNDDNSSVRGKALSFSEYKLKYVVGDFEEESIDYYLKLFKQYKKKDHPKLTSKKWSYIIETWFYLWDSQRNTSVDNDIYVMENIINAHFKTKYTSGDHSVIHFLSGEIKINRYYETRYDERGC